VSDAELAAVATFRSKRRIPVVVWAGTVPPAPVPAMRAVEPENAAAPTRTRTAVLLRSAQPLTGLTGQRCLEDELLLQHACLAAGSDRLLIVDARPMANAIGQAAMGAGYENVEWYVSFSKEKLMAAAGSQATPSTPLPPPLRDAQISFCGVENIHRVRATHAQVEKLVSKLCEEEADMQWQGFAVEMGGRVFQAQQASKTANGTAASAPESSGSGASPAPVSVAPPFVFPTPHPSAASWLSALHGTGHFTHLSNLLSGALHVVSCLCQGITVLTHCSDGWDRTAQLTGLVQIMLDGNYRTIEGFIGLVEKEFLSFGHRCMDRLGHGSFSNECAPVMLQFLDCVYQLIVQFPTHFQFSAHLLLWIHHQMYAGATGTFFFNSEEERVRNQAPERTRSAWWYVMTHVHEFVNATYGTGWSHLAGCTSGTGNARVRSSLGGGSSGDGACFEPHPAFASLPLYSDPTTLFVDVKELRFFNELYLCYKDSSQGLAWNANHVPSAVAALATHGGPGPSVPMAIGGALQPGSSNHADARLDLHPVKWVTECRIRSEQVEELARQLAWAERMEKEHVATLAATREEAKAEAERIRVAADAELEKLRAAAAAERAQLLAELEQTRTQLAEARKPIQAFEPAESSVPSTPVTPERGMPAERDLGGGGGGGGGAPHANGASALGGATPAGVGVFSRLFGSNHLPPLERVPTVIRDRKQYVDGSQCADPACHLIFSLLGNRPCHCRVCGHAFCKEHARSQRLWVANSGGSGSGSGSANDAAVAAAAQLGPRPEDIREQRVCRRCVADISQRAEEEQRRHQERMLQAAPSASGSSSPGVPLRGGIYMPSAPVCVPDSSSATNSPTGNGAGGGISGGFAAAASLPTTRLFSMLSSAVGAGVGAAKSRVGLSSFSTRASSTPRNTRSMSVGQSDYRVTPLHAGEIQEDTSSSDSAEDD